MSVWNGLGGGIIVNSGTELPVQGWTLRKNARLTENSHSGVSATNYELVIKDHSWTADIPWDDTRLPDTDEGLNEGDKVTIRFDKGTSTKFATLTSSSVETLEEVNDVANNILMVRVSGKGGVLTRDIT